MWKVKMWLRTCYAIKKWDPCKTAKLVQPLKMGGKSCKIKWWRPRIATDNLNWLFLHGLINSVCQSYISDKHNSTMAKTTGLICFLFKATSSWHVLFANHSGLMKCRQRIWFPKVSVLRNGSNNYYYHYQEYMRA